MGLDERVKSQGQSLVLSKNVAVWGCRYTPIPERYCSVGFLRSKDELMIRATHICGAREDVRGANHELFLAKLAHLNQACKVRATPEMEAEHAGGRR